MLRSRITPCLLVHEGGLVKTTRFRSPKYVGDPINAVRIFNEKEVDELIVVDIDATVCGRPPDFDLISQLAEECRMPLCYGGGVTSAEQARTIVGLGVEKVGVSSAAIARPGLISDMADAVGSQSVVMVLDTKKSFRGYQAYVHNGTKSTKCDVFELAITAERLGAGEILINSIDNDGMMKGFDMKLVRKMRDAIDLPMSVLGGAGSLNDLESLVNELQIIGAAAGSIFVFKGKYRAVLINYPTGEQKQRVLCLPDTNVRVN